MNKKLIVSIIVGVATITGVAGAAFLHNDNGALVSHRATVNSVDTAPAADPSPTPAPSVSPTPTVTPTITSGQPAGSVNSPSPSPKPTVTYKWESEMATAGLAPSDYQYATAMLLNDNGWRRVVENGTPLWQGAYRFSAGSGDLVQALNYAKGWVGNYYGGSWAAAYKNWTTNGNF